MLPPSHNPFSVADPFRDMGIDLFAAEKEIQARIEAISSELDALPESEKNKKLQVFQDALKALKSVRQRAIAGILQIDRPGVDQIRKRLQALGIADTEQPSLPAPDLSQVLLEGENVELARSDFVEIAPLSKLMIDVDGVANTLVEDVIERHFEFEL